MFSGEWPDGDSVGVGLVGGDGVDGELMGGEWAGGERVLGLVAVMEWMVS